MEALLLATDVAAIGTVNSPPGSSYFAGEHCTTNFLIGFPRTALWIRQDRGLPFVADPTLATIYNRGQVFSRKRISPAGDVAEWFGVAEDVARDAVARFDPRAADSVAPLAFASAPVSAPLYQRQRQLALRASRRDHDVAELEEGVVHLFGDVIAAAYGPGYRGPIAGRAPRRLVEQARAVIAGTFEENLSVRDVARRCDASVFHLCRTFRAETGKTIAGYRREYRLRVALGLVPGLQGAFSRLAVELGFASHSHFTAAFRQAFGTSPSQFAKRAIAPAALRRPGTA